MTDPEQRLWQDVLSRLREAHPEICRPWFDDELALLGIRGGVLWVGVADEVKRVHLHRTCLDAFAGAAQAVTGQLVSVRFVAPGVSLDDLAARTGMLDPRAIADQVMADSQPLNPDLCFETFIIGHHNRLAVAFATAIAEKPGAAYNPFFMHAAVGRGKTHLLQAICLRILQTRPGVRLLYTSCGDFMNRYLECVQQGRMSEFRNRFRDVDVLAIDDVHFLAQREGSQEEFFHTFNSLAPIGRQVLMSSDAAPDQIPHLEARLVSRFMQGLVSEISAPDFETRLRILQMKASLRGLNLNDSVAGMIATQFHTNVRELEGAINSLQLRAKVENRPIDEALVRDFLGPRAEPPTVEVSIGAVLAVVAEHYAVKPAEIQGKRRHRSVTVPRHVCIYLARSHTRFSLEEIGGHFGGRDHSTVLHAIKLVDQRRKDDPEFDRIVDGFSKKLAGENRA